MTAILDGVAVAASIRSRLTATCAALTAAGTVPTLAIVTATDGPVADRWTRTLTRTAASVGIGCRAITLGPHASVSDIRVTLTGLSLDPDVHGIVLQTPLPAGTVVDTVADAIAVAKDVDGANPVSAGRLTRDLPAFAPAIARAVVTLLNHHRVEIQDRQVVVVGRSTAVGKPIADLLLQRNATVTIGHRHTTDLARITRSADIIVAAAGHPGLITADHVHSRAVVIDVGLNPTVAGLIGDVDRASVTGRVAALTPVPGGVGPVTTAMLLDHTLRAVPRA